MLSLIKGDLVSGFSVGFSRVRHHCATSDTLVRDEGELMEVSLMSLPSYEDATDRRCAVGHHSSSSPEAWLLPGSDNPNGEPMIFTTNMTPRSSRWT